MSNTLKQAIESLKSRIADAYSAVSNKGGTLPSTQDSANLPAAIASIPSGGGELQFPADDFLQKITILGNDIKYSYSINAQLFRYSVNEISFDNLTTIYAKYAALTMAHSGITRMRFPKVKENISTSYGFFFDASQNIEYIYIGANGRGNNLKTLFWGNNDRSKISDIEFEQGFGHSIGINDSTDSAIITRETIVDHMLNRLYDFAADPLDGFTPTLSLGTWLSRLTEDDIAIATNKGWTLT